MPGRPAPPSLTAPFDVPAFLKLAGVSPRSRRFPPDAVVFPQGGEAGCVFFLQRGSVKISVVSTAGKEAVIAMFGPGDFFGEGCLAGQPRRVSTATAMVATSALCVPKADMMRALHEQHDFSDRFIAHMIARNIRVEEDLIDQLFNSSEKRLARTLLLLARYGKEDNAERAVPMVSQETLAEIIGSTRSRVNFLMNKFRKLGFIEYNGRLKVNDSLLTVVLHE